MATLATLEDQVRDKLNLAHSDITITLTYGNIADADTVTIDGIVLTCQTDTNPPYELANFKKETDAPATATNLNDLISAIFGSSSGTTSTVSSNVVTVVGASTIVTSKTSGFAIADSTSGGDSPPTSAVIDQWILDAQNEIVNLLVDDALWPLVEYSQANGGGNTGQTIPSDTVRILSVAYKPSGGSVTFAQPVSPAMLDQVTDGNNSMFTTSSKYWAIKNGQIELSSAALDEGNSFEVQYVKSPQTTRGSECDLPNFLEPLVVDYAVAEAKKQVEEYADAAAIKGEFYQKIGAINQRFTRLHKVI